MLVDFLFLIYSLKVVALLKHDMIVGEGEGVMCVFTALAIGFKFLSTTSRELKLI